MPGYLRQSTASQSRAIGPFIDSTDFKTAKTALTIANTDIQVVVNGGASANKNSGGGTHRVNGVYGVTFDATDTATVGEMEVSVSVSGALLVFDKFFVIEEAVFDALFAASAPGYLQPTTAGRTLDVSAAGEAGLDWANVGSPTTALDLSGTTIKTTQKVDVDTIKTQPVTLAGGVTIPAATLASTTNITAGTITTASNLTTNNDKAGYSLSQAFPSNFSSLVIDTSGRVNAFLIGILTSVFTEGATGRIAAAFKQFFNIASPAATMDHGILVDTATSVTNGVTASTVSDKTGYALTSAYDPAKTASQAGDAMALTSGERTTLAASIWNALTSGLTTMASIGKLLVDNINAPISSRATPAQVNTEADTALSDVGLTATITGRIDAAISTRLATSGYTTPPTVGAIADQVWDEAISGHAISGSTGEALSNASAGGTPPSASDIADEVETRALMLTSAERTAIANALLDLSNAIETGVTVRGANRLMLAALAGKLSGANTSTTTIRNAVADTKDRIVATTDATGRTSVTTDQT